jgi:xanthine/uracil permease
MSPDETLINQFMLGAVVLACAVAGMFFLRFRQRTGDRLFAVFAVAFWVLGLNWLALAFIQQDEVRTWLYAVRLAAFVLILWAIWDKNRPRRDAAERS